MMTIRWNLLSRSLGYASLCFLLGAVASQSASAVPVDIFGSGARPETADIPVNDPTDYELGTYFQSSVDGDIVGLRVYLGPVEAANPGTIVGTLWDSGGSILASATYSSITTGWNEVTLSTAVSILADTVYVVSANTNAGSTGTGSYAFDKGPGGNGFFTGGGYSNPPLTALSGRFNTTVGAFPTTTFPTTNGGSSYFRDVQFVESVVIPEPSTLLLVSMGLAGISFAGRRRRSS